MKTTTALITITLLCLISAPALAESTSMGISIRVLPIYGPDGAEITRQDLREITQAEVSEQPDNTDVLIWFSGSGIYLWCVTSADGPVCKGYTQTLRSTSRAWVMVEEGR